MNKRDPLVIAGLSLVTLAAALSSFGALYGVALSAGWSRTMAPLFPVTIDATAMVATRIWLAVNTPTEAARKYARAVAVGAVLVSLLGNGAYHLTEARIIHPGVVLVIAAGAVPPVALAVVAHLAVLRSTPAEVPVPTPAVPLPTPEPQVATVKASKPRVTATPAPERPWDDLLDAARQVDDTARQATGRPAGVTRLKTELRVGQARAQQLRNALATAG